MTELAHLANATQPRLQPELQLQLKGDEPVTVYVQVMSGVAMFSVDQQDWFPNLAWQHGPEYGLYITFVLLTPGIELVPNPTGPTFDLPPLPPIPKMWFSPLLA